MKPMLMSVFLFLVCLSSSTAAVAGGTLTFNYCDLAENGGCEYVINNSIVAWDIGVCSPVNPTFEDQGSQPVVAIGGFECQILTDPGITIVGVSFPAPVVNVGDNSNLVVGFGIPVPVTSMYTVLATVYLSVSGFAEEDLAPNPASFPCRFSVSPAVATFTAVPTLRPAVEGRIAIVDADDTDDSLVLLDHGEGLGAFPEFTFHIMKETVVAAEDWSWGHIKSLYR